MAHTVQLIRHDAYCAVTLLVLKSVQLIANQISEVCYSYILIITVITDGDPPCRPVIYMQGQGPGIFPATMNMAPGYFQGKIK